MARTSSGSRKRDEKAAGTGGVAAGAKGARRTVARVKERTGAGVREPRGGGPGSGGVTIRVTGTVIEVEGEANPTKRAFYRWMAGVAAEAAATAPTVALEEAVSEPSMRSGLLDLVEALPPSSDVSEVTRLREAALARGQRARGELEERAGGLVPTSWVAEHLQVSRQAVEKRRDAGRLLAVRGSGGSYLYPLCQFSEDGVLPGLEEALAAFEVTDPWMRLAGLVNASPALSGRSVIEVLSGAPSDAERERALAVVRAFFAG
jgi:hypothetical protein